MNSMPDVPQDMKDVFHTYFTGLPAAVFTSPREAKELEGELYKRGHSFKTKILRSKLGPRYYVMLVR